MLSDSKPRLSAAKRADEAAKFVEVDLCPEDEIPAPGNMKPFKITTPTRTTILLVVSDSSKVTAFPNSCSHYNLPLSGKSGSVLSKDRIVCPFHAACFNAETGDVEDGPAMDSLPVYPTRIHGGRVYVKIPLTNKNKLVSRRQPCRHVVKAPGSSDGGDIVIVGCGAAAAGAIETILASGHSGSLTVVSKDKAGFWDRVKVSKAISSTDYSSRNVFIDPAVWKEAGVNLMLGYEVTSVDTGSKSLDAVPVEGGDSVAVRYDKLLCASGGPARTFRADRDEGFAIDGAELGNIFVLRDATDNIHVHKAVEEYADAEHGARVVIVGSSFIGMEAAASLQSYVADGLVRSIDVIGMEAEPFERVLGLEVGRVMRARHERAAAALGPAFDLRFHMGARTKAFNGTAVVTSVTVIESDGAVVDLEADLVVLGAGMIPAVGYLAGTDAKVGMAVRVDETLKACDHVWAAGDIAELPNRRFSSCERDAFIRIEHWDSAIDQGRCAARNMLSELAGRPGAPFDVVPFFWTQQLGVNIRYAGHCHFVTEADTIVHGDSSSESIKLTVFYCSGSKVRRGFVCWSTRHRFPAVANDQREQSLIIRIVPRPPCREHHLKTTMTYPEATTVNPPLSCLLFGRAASPNPFAAFLALPVVRLAGFGRRHPQQRPAGGCRRRAVPPGPHAGARDHRGVTGHRPGSPPQGRRMRALSPSPLTHALLPWPRARHNH